MTFEYFDILVMLAAGIVGFGLGGMTDSRSSTLRGIGWFVAGLLVGIVLPVLALIFYPTI